MVARFVSGKSIKGAIRYNEHKVMQGKAALIEAVDFTKDADQLTMSDKIGQFEYLTKKNCQTRRNAIHISLNFDKADQLSKDQLQEIAQSYMAQIGFDNQPYLVYEHYDAAHRHVHIVSTNIKNDGSRISIHNIGRNESETARKAIEDEYNLVKAESKKQASPFLQQPAQLEKAEYGKVETKAAISNIVREVVSEYKFTSIAELNAVLSQFNVIADRGEPGTRMNEKGGLCYSIVDETGKKIGVPIKSSAIYGRPGLANLEKRYGKNANLRKNYKQRLIHVLDRMLENKGLTKQQFDDWLGRNNVRALFRTNETGRIYGVTYVDNATRCVFNGSDLGKAYSANAISEFLRPQHNPNHAILTADPSGSDIGTIGNAIGHLNEGMDTLLQQDDLPEQMDYYLRYNRKRKKKRGPQL